MLATMLLLLLTTPAHAEVDVALGVGPTFPLESAADSDPGALLQLWVSIPVPLGPVMVQPEVGIEANTDSAVLDVPIGAALWAGGDRLSGGAYGHLVLCGQYDCDRAFGFDAGLLGQIELSPMTRLGLRTGWSHLDLVDSRGPSPEPRARHWLSTSLELVVRFGAWSE